MRCLSERINEIEWVPGMAPIPERVASLEERVANHIKFFWLVVGALFLWLSAVSVTLYQMNGTLNHLALPQRLESAASSSPQKAFSQIASLPQSDFSRVLPALREIASQPPSKVAASTASVLSVAKKLSSADRSSPEYWPTVLGFIQFASASLSTPEHVPPPNGPYTVASNVRCTGVAHCIEASNRSIELDAGSIPGSIFYNCRIKFTNNPVNPSGVRFINCVFEMPKESAPNDYLKSSAQILLASNFFEVTFPVS
jgi:hypothetical protein